MDEAKLLGLIDQYISDSEDYDGSERAGRRKTALEYFNAQMSAFEPPEGKSRFVSQDVADAVGWLLPGLMRVFLTGDRVAEFDPQNPNDEPFAKQATDYINYVLMREGDGYANLRAAMHEALLLGNGMLKHWWDDSKQYAPTTEAFTGISEDLLPLFLKDPELEIVSVKEVEGKYEQGGDTEGMGDSEPASTFDIKAKRIKSNGCLRIEAIADEDFLIERNARALTEGECRFVAHKGRLMRSDLVAMGYKKAKVDGLPEVTQTIDTTARDPSKILQSEDIDDKASQRVLTYECYILVDYDGDGIAERRKILVGGDKGKRSLLANEEWGEDLPFSDLVPDPVPHVWKGRSIYDDVKAIQEVKTVLTRKMLDNLYQTVEPSRAVDISKVINPDELIDIKTGAVIQTKGDPNAIIKDLAVPFVAKEAFPMLEYMDNVAERRTGVGANSQGLDQDALQNQTATAVEATQAAQSTKKEDYARNIAEIGLKRFFKCLLKLIVRHQDKPRTIRLRDEWVTMDPRAWNADMDVTINTGLGNGNRDRDLQILNGIAIKQQEVIGMFGPDNPICGLERYSKTLQRIATSGGLKGADDYFGEVTPEQVQELAQKMSQKPDPKAAAMQAQVQIAGQKAQADAQLAQQKAQVEAKLSQDKAGAEVQLKAQAGQAQLGLDKQKMDAQSAIDLEEMTRKHDFAMQEMAQKYSLEMQKLQADIGLKQIELASEAELERESMQNDHAIKKAQIKQADPV